MSLSSAPRIVESEHDLTPPLRQILNFIDAFRGARSPHHVIPDADHGFSRPAVAPRLARAILLKWLRNCNGPSRAPKGAESTNAKEQKAMDHRCSADSAGI